MRRFVLEWKKLGHEKRLKAYIINYADDLVICCCARAYEALVTDEWDVETEHGWGIEARANERAC